MAAIRREQNHAYVKVMLDQIAGLPTAKQKAMLDALIKFDLVGDQEPIPIPIPTRNTTAQSRIADHFLA